LSNKKWQEGVGISRMSFFGFWQQGCLHQFTSFSDNQWQDIHALSSMSI